MNEIPFSHNKPIPWRVIDPGICLEGRCLSRRLSCPAYQKMVIGNLQMGYFKISRANSFACPICHSVVFVEKLGLNRCQWRTRNTRKWSNTGDVYQLYNLSRMPIYIEVRSSNEGFNTNDNCSICLTSMANKTKCSILPCKHVFHMACIQEWINADEETSFQCPICRKDIFGEDTD